MDRKLIAAVGLCMAWIASSTTYVPAQETSRSNRLEVDSTSDGIPARFVQRRGRFIERQQLKEMEDYYDDLEDFYKDRDPALAEYYESWEKYYEDVRKGKPAYMPPEIVIGQVPGEGSYLAPPGMESRQPRIAYRQPIQAGPHTNLERSYRELRRQLARLNTGDTWLAYFDLPFNLHRDSTSLDLLMTERSKAQFAEAMRRFDQIAADPTYKVVAQRPAFNRTRYALRSFTQWHERQPTLEEPEEVQGEEIPLPPQEPQPANDGPVLPPQ